MGGEDLHQHYRKDLSHLTEEEVWTRQQRRAPLLDRWWRLLEGRPGMRLLDVGSGPGFFTLAFASLVGPEGRVLAVDLRPEPLAFLDRRRPPNVRTLVWDVEAAPLPETGFDAVLLTDVLHHAERPAEVLARLRGAAPRLLVAEFDPEGPGEMGPPAAERIAPAEMDRLLREAGWTPARREAHPFEHYAILATADAPPGER